MFRLFMSALIRVYPRPLYDGFGKRHSGDKGETPHQLVARRRREENE